MSKYRKKPIIIEAFQYIDWLAAPEWFHKARRAGIVESHEYRGRRWCEIKTLEGVMTGEHGDYIIQGINGELYPCKPDIFEKSYEKFGDEK